MKKLVCLVLAVVLCASVMSFSAGDTQAEAENVTVVSFDNLTELVIAANDQYKSVDEQLHKLSLNLRDLEKDHKKAMENPAMAWSAAPAIQNSMKAITDAMDDLKDGLPKTTEQLTQAARQMYVAYYIAVKEAEIAERSLRALNEDLPGQKQKRALGLLSQSAFEAYEKSIKTAEDRVKTTKNSCDDNLRSLADYLNIKGTIKMSGVPSFDTKRITVRDIEADKAAYIIAATDVVDKEEALKKANETFETSKTDANKYAIELAKTDVVRAKEKAESDFPKMYRDLYDSCVDYTDAKDVKDTREALDKATSQYAKGLIAKNKFTAAQRDYQAAVDRYAQQGMQLYLSLLDYEYELVKWK